MNEKEKFLNGEWYDAGDSELVELRSLAKVTCDNYNRIALLNSDKALDILKKFLGRVGDNIEILPNFWCDYGFNICVGKKFFANHNMVILDCAPVEFGDNVLVGPNCSFYTAIHPFDVEKRNAGIELAKPIKVGNNVWFGGNVTVLPGVTIDDNCVIGAGSIVTKDVKAGSIVAGNPAKIIREI